jgi:hypothetical protein
MLKMIISTGLKTEKGFLFAGTPLFHHATRSIDLGLTHSIKKFNLLSTIILNKNKRGEALDLPLSKDNKLLHDRNLQLYEKVYFLPVIISEGTLL